MEKGDKAWKEIQNGSEKTKHVEEALVNAPDSVKQAIAKQGKELVKQIDELEKLYMMPEGLKGIQRSSDNLVGAYYGASRYLSASDGAPNQAAQIMLNEAKEETAEVVGQVNAFFEEDFAKYREAVEAVQMSLFKAYEPVTVEE